MMPGGPEGPSRPPQDFQFSLPDRQDFVRALANVFNDHRSVENILRLTTFPRGRIPAFENSSALEVWGEILLQIDFGAIPAGNRQLLLAVLDPYPHHGVFRRLADTYLGPAWAAAEPAAGPESADRPDTCHVIVRASAEETRQEAEQELSELGLEPEEQWSTAHAASFRVNSSDTDRVRDQLEQASFGWTAVAPGLPDYLLRTLNIEGPDGRQFRITDAPAQQTVGNIAAEVVEQYGQNLPDAGRPAVIDVVDAEGQGHRLDPNTTLDESGIRDGDRLRVGFQAQAAAVNPSDRQDALYRVYNQIIQFAETRDPESDFVVSGSPAFLPTEYELEFTHPSFGPPPAPDLPPADIDRHRVLIQLETDFPETPPLVFWLTPIFHPNVFPNYECEQARGREAQMGLVCLGALQESYLPSLHFGSLCQLLLDIVSYRNYSIYTYDGTIDSSGRRGRKADFFDSNAAAWVLSAAGQRRIAGIKGSPLAEPSRQRPEYRNVIERVGEE